MPDRDTDERIAAIDAAHAIAFSSALPVETYTHTREGMSMEMEERTAEARFKEYSRTHPSAGLKKPKLPKRGRGRGGRGYYGDDGDDDEFEEEFGFAMMRGMFGF